MLKKVLFIIIVLLILIHPSYADEVALDSRNDDLRSSNVVFKDVYVNDMGRVWNKTLFYKDYLIVLEGDFFDENNLQIFKLEKDEANRLNEIDGLPLILPSYSMPEIHGDYLFISYYELTEDLTARRGAISFFDLSGLPDKIIELNSWDGSFVHLWDKNDSSPRIEIKRNYLYFHVIEVLNPKEIYNAIIVYDITNPFKLIEKARLEFPYNSPIVGKEIFAFEIQGNILYILESESLQGGKGYVPPPNYSLDIYRINDDLKFTLLKSYDLNYGLNIYSGIQVQDKYAYILTSPNTDNNSLLVLNVSDPENIKKVTSIKNISKFNMISKNRAAGFDESFDFSTNQITLEVSFIDISNPEGLKILGSRLFGPITVEPPYYLAGYYNLDFAASKNYIAEGGTVVYCELEIAHCDSFALNMLWKIEGVDVLSFDAKAKKNKTILTWQTAIENGVNGFYIERENGNGEGKKSFKEMIPAKGGDSQGASYKFIDRSIRKGKFYTYKLFYKDNDGERHLLKSTNLSVPAN